MLHRLLGGRPVLVLGAHPDDEMGCGATIARLIDLEVAVHHFYLSPCTQSLEAIGLPEEQLRDECDSSRRILGIPPENCGNFDFPVRYFPKHRQEILEEMILLGRRIQPGLVLVPNSHDIHQDHHCVFEEALRAYKHASVLGYEMPWNTMTMDHDCLARLEEEHMARKMEALACYRSQAGRIYANKSFFESLARVRGVQANAEYAECFEVIRLYL